MSPSSSFDAVVVGASLAGCTAATLMARAGARVALVERHASVMAHKQLCTHFIQASAWPVLRRLGLDARIEEAGGLRNGAEVHTPYGWIGDLVGEREDGQRHHGYNISRQRLDPMVRRLAGETPGVHLMCGMTAKRLIERDDRIAGVEVRGDKGEAALHARVVVAADGRGSEMAALAGVKPRTRPNLRHGVAMMMRGVDLPCGTSSLMWMTGPEVAYLFPNEDGMTMVAWMAPHAMLEGIARADLREALMQRIRDLPGAPRLHAAVPAGRLLAIKDHTSLWRPPLVRGMALLGDAACSLDYLQGVGCGWAFQSGAWLADALAPVWRAGAAVPAQGKPLDDALKAYARRHEAAIGPHRFFINDFAARLSFNGVERLLYAAAAKDAVCAHRLARVGARLDAPTALLRPGALARSAWVNLTRRSGPQGTRALAAPAA